jgi:hypothetical protein
MTVTHQWRLSYPTSLTIATIATIPSLCTLRSHRYSIRLYLSLYAPSPVYSRSIFAAAPPSTSHRQPRASNSRAYPTDCHHQKYRQSATCRQCSHDAMPTTSRPEVGQIIERVPSVLSLLLHRMPLSRIYMLTSGGWRYSRGFKKTLTADTGSSGVEEGDLRPTRKQQHSCTGMAVARRVSCFSDCQRNPFHQSRLGFRLCDKDSGCRRVLCE